MSADARILLIEDDAQMRRFLRVTLQGHGYRFEEAAAAAAGLEAARASTPDLILLDLGLPDIDGVEVARRLRLWCHAPIIVLSARGQEDDKIKALDAGADDYLTKPFGSGELLARIRVALRNSALQRRGLPVVVVGELQIDLAERRVLLGGSEVHLSPIEYRILALLARHPGSVITHQTILSEAWGQAAGGQVQHLRVYMALLRRKLESDPARPRYLVNEPGVGYRLRTG